MWNVAMITTLIVFGAGSAPPRLAIALAWGSVVGSALQFAVQVPTVLRVAPDLRIALDVASEHIRTVGRNFVPVFISRGVVQVSAYIDALLATLLPTGAVTGIANAAILYTLPVSLFGMSVAASELPAMAGAAALDDSAARSVRARLEAGLRRIAFFVVPSSMAFFAFGDLIAGALLQTGRFTRADAVYVWGILAGSSIGLVAQTLGRLYASTYYALRDTRTPLGYAMVRVTVTTLLGYFCAIPLPRAIGLDPMWGAAGLTASAGIAGWVEMLLLRTSLATRIGTTGLRVSYVLQLWGAAALGAALGWTIKLLLPPMHPILQAALVLTPYGLTYFAVTLVGGIPESSATIARLWPRRR
jgi:putative peptidoglycan lipid II flippase